MTLNGLENNYYLSGNDIWIQLHSFGGKTAVRLELYVINNTQGWDLQPLLIYPNPQQLFRFNISLPVRALQPEPQHLASPLNTMQSYKLRFTVLFTDGTNEVLTLDKFFIRGGRDKAGATEWHLEDGAHLVVGKWAEWAGIEPLPLFAHRIAGDQIINFAPTGDELHRIWMHGVCDYKLIKFLNSLGGYQFWIFESWEIKKKAKAKKTVSRIPLRLRADVHRDTGTEYERVLGLKTKTPVALQEVLDDLISSPEVLLYDPAGTDGLSRWHRLQLENNDTVLNSVDRVYQNEISYIFPSYINRDL